jgi:hypothetical protein
MMTHSSKSSQPIKELEISNPGKKGIVKIWNVKDSFYLM